MARVRDMTDVQEDLRRTTLELSGQLFVLRTQQERVRRLKARKRRLERRLGIPSAREQALQGLVKWRAEHPLRVQS